MKRSLLLIGLGILGLLLVGYLTYNALYPPVGSANSTFTNVKPVRAVRLEYIDNAKSRQLVVELEKNMRAAGVNLVAVGAGREDWTYFPWKGHSGQWASEVKDSGQDLLGDDSARFGKWAHVTAVVDALAPQYVQAHPESAAISYTGARSSNLVGVMDMAEGDFGQNLLGMIDYIAANYPVNSVMITELVYYVDGYGPKDRAAYLAFSKRSDWPRSADGKINIDDPSIGEWRSFEINEFYKKAADILHKYNKQLFVEVHVNVDENGYVYVQNGVNFDNLLKYADRLLVWGYYNQDQHKPEILTAIGQYIARHDPNRIIMTIGLWNHNYDVNTSKTSMDPIPVADLQTAISAARKGGATDFFITPSFLLTPPHWSALNQSWK